jgi:serine/threonine protein kinase
MPSPSLSIPDFSNATIGNNRYKCLEKIGSGAFGAVYRAVDSKATSADINPAQYAVKILAKFVHDPEDPTSLSQESPLLAQQEREIWIHKAISSHENVVTLHETFDEGLFRFLILDYCDGPNLYERFYVQPYWRKDDAIKELFLQVLRTVQHIHSQGIYHRYIKPENILCSSDGRVFLTDFGLSTMNKHSASFRCGSVAYMSPGMLAIVPMIKFLI